MPEVSLFMSIAELQNLSKREKLQLFACLWETLVPSAEGSEVSEFEKSLLDGRLAQLRYGESGVHEWDDVKMNIGSGNS
jgi:hypothetical protein